MNSCMSLPMSYAKMGSCTWFCKQKFVIFIFKVHIILATFDENILLLENYLYTFK